MVLQKNCSNCNVQDGHSLGKENQLSLPFWPGTFKWQQTSETNKLPVPVLKGKNVAKIEHQYW